MAAITTRTTPLTTPTTAPATEPQARCTEGDNGG